jgi:hypothetical protein
MRAHGDGPPVQFLYREKLGMATAALRRPGAESDAGPRHDIISGIRKLL